MKNTLSSNDLVNYYLKAQKYGHQYREGKKGLIILLSLAVILPFSYIIIFNINSYAEKNPVFYVLWFAVIMYLLWFLVYAYIKFLDNKMFKALNISSTKYIPDQASSVELYKHKVNDFYNSLFNNNLLTSDITHNLALFKVHTDCLQREITIEKKSSKPYIKIILPASVTQVAIGILPELFKSSFSTIELQKYTPFFFFICIAAFISMLPTIIYTVLAEGSRRKRISNLENTLHYLEIIRDNLIYEDIIEQTRKQQEDERKKRERNRIGKVVDVFKGVIKRFW